MKIHATLILASLIGGCSPSVVYRDRLVEVKVPVPQPCVVGTRPDPVTSIKQEISAENWKALDVRQKAAVVAKKGLAHKTYGENINAATAGCP